MKTSWEKLIKVSQDASWGHLEHSPSLSINLKFSLLIIEGGNLEGSVYMVKEMHCYKITTCTKTEL